MKTSGEVIERLKWAIYDWIGAVSVYELSGNKKLAMEIERLCRSLATIAA